MRAETLRFIDVLQEEDSACVRARARTRVQTCSLCACVSVMCMHVYRLLHDIRYSKDYPQLTVRYV